MKCGFALIVIILAIRQLDAGTGIRASNGFTKLRKIFGTARHTDSYRKATYSSRARAGGWAPKPRVNNQRLLDQLAIRRRLTAASAAAAATGSAALAAPLLLDDTVYFLESSILPNWTVSHTIEDAREAAKHTEFVENLDGVDNSTCVFASNDKQQGRICEIEAALICVRNLTVPRLDPTQTSLTEDLTVYFYCRHNEACVLWDCGEDFGDVSSGVDFAIIFFGILSTLALLMLCRAGYSAYKIDKEFQARMRDHQPIYLTEYRREAGTREGEKSVTFAEESTNFLVPDANIEEPIVEKKAVVPSGHNYPSIDEDHDGPDD